MQVCVNVCDSQYMHICVRARERVHICLGEFLKNVCEEKENSGSCGVIRGVLIACSFTGMPQVLKIWLQHLSIRILELQLPLCLQMVLEMLTFMS